MREVKDWFIAHVDASPSLSVPLGNEAGESKLNEELTPVTFTPISA